MDAGADSPPVVVVTADLELLDHVLASAAAAGVEPHVVSDPASVRTVWLAAPTVVVGVDQAAELARLSLPRRPEVFVVGEEGSWDEVCAWSMPLGAAVVLLPEGANRLTDALADAAGLGQGGGRVVALLGGSGGVGASTCAAALAFSAAQSGLRTLLLDVDPIAGGLDLLVGAERVPGWRWPRLSTARGHLGDLTGHLPQVDGVDVLSMARGSEQRLAPIGGEQVKAVLMSATRSHDVVVVDVPRHLTAAGREVWSRADLTLLVVLAELRGIAAAQQVLAQLDAGVTVPDLLVRTTRPRTIRSDAVGESLGLAVAGTVSDDTSLAQASARGEPPGRSSRSALGRSCRQVLEMLPLAGRPG